MFTEEQKHYTGRAILALAAAHMEVINAMHALAEYNPEEAARIAQSMAKNASIAAGMCQLAVAAAPSEPMEEDPAHLVRGVS